MSPKKRRRRPEYRTNTSPPQNSRPTWLPIAFYRPRLTRTWLLFFIMSWSWFFLLKNMNLSRHCKWGVNVTHIEITSYSLTLIQTTRIHCLTMYQLYSHSTWLILHFTQVWMLYYDNRLKTRHSISIRSSLGGLIMNAHWWLASCHIMWLHQNLNLFLYRKKSLQVPTLILPPRVNQYLSLEYSILLRVICHITIILYEWFYFYTLN